METKFVNLSTFFKFNYYLFVKTVLLNNCESINYFFFFLFDKKMKKICKSIINNFFIMILKINIF